ncbi:hypothetical protein M432DRAFT_617677 [Thermoascus aurantiacus ATCC 26904]
MRFTPTSLLLLLAGILFASAATAVDAPPGCYWAGKAPMCQEPCPQPLYWCSVDRCGDGKCCTSGMKILCCTYNWKGGCYR